MTRHEHDNQLCWEKYQFTDSIMKDTRIRMFAHKPVGKSMNSCIASLFPAWLPPLITLNAGTGSTSSLLPARSAMWRYNGTPYSCQCNHSLQDYSRRPTMRQTKTKILLNLNTTISLNLSYHFLFVYLVRSWSVVGSTWSRVLWDTRKFRSVSLQRHHWTAETITAKCEQISKMQTDDTRDRAELV